MTFEQRIRRIERALGWAVPGAQQAANMQLVALYRTAAPRLARMVRALQNQIAKRGEP